MRRDRHLSNVQISTPKTLRVGRRQVSISAEEADLLAPLVAYLRELNSAPFGHDRPACFVQPPRGVVTPLRIRAMIRDWLSPLSEQRRAILTAEVLGSLTIRGMRLDELEKLGRLDSQP